MEETSDQNRVHSVSIPHITSSIHAHGIGILNTIVQIVYKDYIKKLINNIIQIMMDENLQSSLKREERWITKKKKKAGLHIDPRYEFTRA